MLNLHNQMAGLSKGRSIFYSEADFQFAFTWEIQRHIIKQQNIAIVINYILEKDHDKDL